MADVIARIDEKSLKNVNVKITFDMSFQDWLELQETLPSNYTGSKFGGLIGHALKHLRQTFTKYVPDEMIADPTADEAS